MVRLDDLLKNPPKLHLAGGEIISDWKLSDEELRFLDSRLTEGVKTIETGAGLSTILFAMKGARHTCVVPDADLVGRIKAFCGEHGIPQDGVRYIIDPSELALPRLSGNDYDLALIDGRHGFPAPFIDWYYMSGLLKEGGILIIDDLHIWTSEILKQFLLSEPDWALEIETTSAAAFSKRGEGSRDREWIEQAFVTDRSRARSATANLRYLLSLLRRGKFLLFRTYLGILFRYLAGDRSAGKRTRGG